MTTTVTWGVINTPSETAAATGVGGVTNVLTSGTRVIGSLTYSV